MERDANDLTVRYASEIRSEGVLPIVHRSLAG